MDFPDQYRAEDADALILRALDDITLIYHRRSGQTHMVASPVPEILAAIGSDGSTAGEVLVALAMQYDLGDPADALPVVVAHLQEMAALGLVRRS